MKKISMLVVFLMAVCLSGSALALVETTVFGPETYQRTTGRPNVYQETFSTSVGDEGTVVLAKLLIKNGDPGNNNWSRRHMVRSAMIKINGSVVVSPRDFKWWVDKIEVPLRLKKDNSLYVELQGIPGSSLTLKIDYETGPLGPIFTGRKQYPFLCRTELAGLGQPLVDNHEGDGIKVFVEDAAGDKTDEVAGFCKDCSMATRVDYFYRSTIGGGGFKRLTNLHSRPPDLARTTTSAGLTVDYIVRLERGTINRFIYGIAMLAPFDLPVLGYSPTCPLPSWRGNDFGWDTRAWNRKLIYQFQGGVGIGHQQGSGWATNMINEDRDLADGGPLYHDGLAAGYAVAFSTGTTTDTHYNLSLSAETMMMIKNHFMVRYGRPKYTVGVGGSGGSIQQYFIGQNHPRLLDGGIPQYSYSDMVTQATYVGDCSLLEFYFDVVAPAQGDDYFGGTAINFTDPALPPVRYLGPILNRTLIEGLSSSDTIGHPIYKNFGIPGSTECVNGWLGLLPLTINPLWTDTIGLDQLPAEVVANVKWTHWNDLENIYGVDPETGIAPNTWDNVGVQYGLQALKDNKITPEQFLDINAKIGGWKDPKLMIQEGWPFFPSGDPADLAPDFSNFDPWSIRNSTVFMPHSLGVAQRTTGSLDAMKNAYRSGHVFTGRLRMPVIDSRHYLDEDLNMHHAQQSFATRQRLIDGQGHAKNQLIWFAGYPYDLTMDAFNVLDKWIYNIQHWVHGPGVAANKPATAVDQCVDDEGNLIAKGDNVWDGILNGNSQGPCTQSFPLYSTSRIVAGGNIKGDVFKCHLIPVDTAISRGFYNPVDISPARDRLKEIFPDGVCDYSQSDQGRPGNL